MNIRLALLLTASTLILPAAASAAISSTPARRIEGIIIDEHDDHPALYWPQIGARHCWIPCLIVAAGSDTSACAVQCRSISIRARSRLVPSIPIEPQA